jgi:hypothetical protein
MPIISLFSYSVCCDSPNGSTYYRRMFVFLEAGFMQPQPKIVVPRVSSAHAFLHRHGLRSIDAKNLSPVYGRSVLKQFAAVFLSLNTPYTPRPPYTITKGDIKKTYAFFHSKTLANRVWHFNLIKQLLLHCLQIGSILKNAVFIYVRELINN